MCGITGIIHKNDKPVDLNTLQNMTRRLTHRGPDDEGYYVNGPVGLGHRRLSIIDLEGGHQPMTTNDGRYTLIFNGEIYNFLDLRRELEKEGASFSTCSDSEVLLTLFARKGKECLSDLNGMFVFSIWDSVEKKLFAARDRMGKKPFYYWETSAHFAFASECKALVGHPNFSSQLNMEALKHYFQYEYVPAPYSIYQGVKKLPAGHFLVMDGKGIRIEPYWKIPLDEEKIQNEEEIEGKIIDLLDRAVERRLISDVPLGVFLSGGVDSSAVVALMARHHEGKEIKTFSIGFEEESFDESQYAALIAKKFGTDHYHQVLNQKKMLGILPEVVDFLDEPFADYSIIPTYLLSAFTRKTVTVALGGDGGDELFAGYPTFFADRLARLYSSFPNFLKKMTQYGVGKLPVSDKDISFDFKAKQFLYGASFPAVIRNQVWLGAFHHEEQKNLFIGGDSSPQNPLSLVDEVMKSCSSGNPGDRLLYFYQKFYLCDDILVKTDRASMATSLEVRAPFLDVDFVEYVSRIPYGMKLKRGETKHVLKKALKGILPENIIHRKKKGFGIPIALWLRDELKNKMLETLDRKKIQKEGIFNPDTVDRIVGEHLAGKRNNRKQIFSLLMFEWWREKYL